ncbi:solute carrier family 22 member 6-like [Daphnia pulex]|uniref:solute carrier family 22 member 6-like n=1 Tax=Daphnia pulex TaxID=6669 RepID=UPI001EDFB6FB|nr:solute carrier family 22 member 6-like [Daphnia pulex]
MFAVEKIGRRPMLSSGLLLSGLSCLTVSLVPTDVAYIKTIFSLIAKLFAACVTATLFSYTSELFPTSSRSAMVGLCSTSGRIGGIIAPIISDWGKNNGQTNIPFFIFATINILIGFLSLLLPETKDTAFPATINEAIEMEKNSIVLQFWKKTERRQHTQKDNADDVY